VRCPRCAVEMTVVEDGGLRAHRCPECEGMWLPGENLAAAIRLEAAEQGVHIATVSLLEGPAVPCDRPCPTCASPMNRLTMRGVEVERCPSCHGVFLDYGEGALITRRVVQSSKEWGPAYATLQRLLRQRFRGPEAGPGDASITIP